MTDYRVRSATPADLETVLRHRRCMFEEMGHRDPGALHAMLETSTPLLRRGLDEGTYRGWLVETATGEVVSGGGLISIEFHSHPADPVPRRAWVVNMYTEPAHRRRGLARLVMDAILAWCREAGLRTVYLHASDAGRPLYEALGFESTSEMRLRL